MVNAISVYESILPELCEIRRSQTAASFRLFAKTYFPHYQKVPPSIMHQELYDILQNVDEQASQRVAVAAPRGNAKSTLVSLFFILWIICTEREKYVLLLSDTKDKAAQFLANVREELQTNEILRKDYPHVCELPGRRPAPRRWRETKLETRNGCCIAAAGAGQSLRGSRFQSFRPGLIILDDIENEENTATPEAREKLEAWFNRTVLKAGNPQTHIVMVGTIQHYDSLLAKLTSIKMSTIWESRIFRSVLQWAKRDDLWEKWARILHGHEVYNDLSGLNGAKQYFIEHQQEMLKNTQVLWPELEDYHQLMIMRETEGHWAFNAEKQNEPVNKEDCLFDPDEFYYWDEQYGSVEELIAYVSQQSNDWFTLAACDPSLGKQGKRHDYSAIIVLLYDRQNKRFFILDADLKKRKPDRIISDLIEYARLKNLRLVGVESVQFQEYLVEELKKTRDNNNLRFQIKGIKPQADKIGRIQNLQPFIASGKLQFNRRHRLLLDQFRMFPKGDHDDGPDALEMAIQIADKEVQRVLRIRRLG